MGPPRGGAGQVGNPPPVPLDEEEEELLAASPPVPLDEEDEEEEELLAASPPIPPDEEEEELLAASPPIPLDEEEEDELLLDEDTDVDEAWLMDAKLLDAPPIPSPLLEEQPGAPAQDRRTNRNPTLRRPAPALCAS